VLALERKHHINQTETDPAAIEQHNNNKNNANQVMKCSIHHLDDAF